MLRYKSPLFLKKHWSFNAVLKTVKPSYTPSSSYFWWPKYVIYSYFLNLKLKIFIFIFCNFNFSFFQNILYRNISLGHGFPTIPILLNSLKFTEFKKVIVARKITKNGILPQVFSCNLLVQFICLVSPSGNFA